MFRALKQEKQKPTPTLRMWRQAEEVGGGPARALPEDGHVVGVAPERGDVVPHPLQRPFHVPEAVVAGVGRVGGGEEAEHARPVVERHHDHVLHTEASEKRRFYGQDQLENYNLKGIHFVLPKLYCIYRNAAYKNEQTNFAHGHLTISNFSVLIHAEVFTKKFSKKHLDANEIF